MKTPFVVFGLTIALVTSLSAQVAKGLKGQHPETEAFQQASSRNLHPSRILVVKARNKEPQVYYLTNFTVTGSHIPVVIRRYKGVNQPIDSGFRRNDVYVSTGVGTFGDGDLRNTLRKVEPAFF